MDGKSFQDRFLNMIHFGDWLSYWCAILHKSDPTPVFKIEKLKSQLDSYKKIKIQLLNHQELFLQQFVLRSFYLFLFLT